jgi:hypothetical protein
LYRLANHKPIGHRSNSHEMSTVHCIPC